MAPIFSRSQRLRSRPTHRTPGTVLPLSRLTLLLLPRLTLLLLLAALGAACSKGSSLEIGGVAAFSDSLRADLRPLRSSDLADDRRYLREGENGGLIDTLVPTEMPPGELRKLRRSGTYWTAGGSLALSYEFVFEDPTWNGRKPTLSRFVDDLEDSRETATLVGFHPDTGLTDPVTRRLVMFDGKGIATPYDPRVTNYTVHLHRCQDGASLRDPNQPAGRLDASCTQAEVNAELCSDVLLRSTALPYTVVKCEIIADQDASFALEAVDTRTGRNMAETFEKIEHERFEDIPTIRPVRFVDGTRTLARPLRLEDEGCYVESAADPEERPCVREDEDPGDGSKYLRSRWIWQVGEDARSGEWDENFSSRLQVTHVYLFVQDPQVEGLAGRRYLGPEHIEELRVGDDVDCPALEDPETGRAVFDLNACEQQLLVTPTYDHAWLADSVVDERLRWRPRFRVTALGAEFPADLPVQAGDDLFIEFEVDAIGRVNSYRGLTLAPGVLDFGEVKRDSKNTRERAVRLVNLGLYSETVTELRIDGSPDFAAYTSDGRTFPFVLAAGEETHLSVSVVANGSGLHEARAVVRSLQSGRPQEIEVILRSNTVFADANLLPGSLGFEAPKGQGLSQAAARVRRILLESVGHAELPVYSVSIVGRDAHQFSVLDSLGRDLASEMYALPYPAPTWIPSGDAHILAVVYHPDASTLGGDLHRARIVVEHEAGSDSVELFGTCDFAPGDCAYATPPNAP